MRWKRKLFRKNNYLSECNNQITTCYFTFSYDKNVACAYTEKMICFVKVEDDIIMTGLG